MYFILIFRVLTVSWYKEIYSLNPHLTKFIDKMEMRRWESS